jgi:phage terminase large subunit-like protein
MRLPTPRRRTCLANELDDPLSLFDPESWFLENFRSRALILAILLTQLRPGDRAYGIGADKDQARLLHDAAVGFIQRTPGLAHEFTIGSYRISAKRTGATFEALAADAPGAWGLLGRLYVLDEAAQYPVTPSTTQFVEAITSAAAKVSDARMVVLTTAGSPSHPAHKLLDHAKRDSLWRVHEVRGPSPWADPERLAEQKRRLPESSYLRLFENVWTEPEDALVLIDDLRAAIQLDGPQDPKPGERYVIGLDVGLKNDEAWRPLPMSRRPARFLTMRNAVSP